MKKIEPDITRASTIPASFYRSQEMMDLSRDQIFARSWQLTDGREHLRLDDDTYPFMLLQGFINEPLVLVKGANNSVSCFSNVCTHRGNILVQQAGRYKKFICDYHGRRFSRDGKFESMPEFHDAQDFPRDCDDLHRVEVKQWEGFPFVSLDPAFDFQKIVDVLERYVCFLPVSQFRHAPELYKEYLVNAHWALYCDNYLEGFHIPFVHPDLNRVLDYKQYKTQLFDYCNLQTGVADEGADCFDLPPGHVDYGQRIAAYYLWIFPNMMFNFYPWGLSINIVRPLSSKQSKVAFITYVYDEAKFEKGAATLLDKVEREDEHVVENVQRGIQSRFYQSGRFSPAREQGVHHFHTLISKHMNMAIDKVSE